MKIAIGQAYNGIHKIYKKNLFHLIMNMRGSKKLFLSKFKLIFINKTYFLNLYENNIHACKVQWKN